MGLAITVLVAIALAPAAAGPMQRAPRMSADAERAQAHYRVGVELLQSEDFEGAAKAFQAAIDLNPRFTLAYYGLGRSLMALRRYAAAIDAYLRCRDLYVARAGEKFTGQIDATRYRQDRLMELNELARQYSTGPQTQQTQDTLRQIQNAIRRTNLDVQIGNNLEIDASVPAFVSVALGSAYFRANRMADAEREYKAAIAADDKAGEAHNNLAVVYMLTDRPDEALKAVALAEKSGFRVNPDLKRDIADRRKK